MAEKESVAAYILLAKHQLLQHLGQNGKEAPVPASFEKNKNLSQHQRERFNQVVQPLIDRWKSETDAKAFLNIPKFAGTDAEKKQLVLQIVKYEKLREGYDGKLNHVEDKINSQNPPGGGGNDPPGFKLEELGGIIPGESVEIQGSGDAELYSTENTDARKEWPYLTVRDKSTGICILFEKKTLNERDGKPKNLYGVQIEEGSIYKRKILTEAEVKKESSGILEEWAKHDSVTEDTIERGVVTETNPERIKRLIFQTSSRRYSTKTHGNIVKIHWLAINPYARTTNPDKAPRIEFCVSFEKTRYPKLILKSAITPTFLNPKMTITAIDDLTKRDGLGSIEGYTPLEKIYYDPMSNKFDERVHGRHALKRDDDALKREDDALRNDDYKQLMRLLSRLNLSGEGI